MNPDPVVTIKSHEFGVRVWVYSKSGQALVGGLGEALASSR